MGLSLAKSCDNTVLAESTKVAPLPVTLVLRDGKLTGRIAGMPLAQVMEKLSQLSGAQVRWLDHQETTAVSAEFVDLPLADALERLLPRKNFLLVYASLKDNARLITIWISSPGTGATQLQIIRPLPVQEQPQVIDDDPPPEELDAEPATVLEGQLRTALHGDEAGERLEAIEALSGMVEHDPRIRPLLVQLSTGEHDPQVRGAAEEALAGLE
jgi:hypothetical protein